MVESVTKTLGSGSGIDIGAFVTSLVDAQYVPKTEAFTKREETLKAQISAVSSLKSTLTTFSTALANLVKGGSLATQPTSSDASVLKVSALPGARVGTLANAVEVKTLATAQVAVTTAARTAGEAVGTGSIAIRFDADADGDFSNDVDGAAIEITDADKTLAGIAAKINAAKQGVTAQVVNDGTGERLILKGPTGAAKAFTLTATDGDQPGLAAAINVGGTAPGATQIATTAGDAELTLDGIPIKRATNSVSDLIPGVKLDLVSVGTRPVTLGSSTPTDALKTAVNDVVLTYNELYAELKTATDPQTGALARDQGAQDMLRALRGLSLVDLTGTTDGSPKTLAEIGVATNRDGTLRVDATQLANALTRSPAAVEAMFADRGVGASKRGLSAALTSIATAVNSKTFGLGASETRYKNLQTKLTDEKTAADLAKTQMTERLTQTYASMDARVAAYKATQSFLTNQVAAWNRDS